MSDILDGLTPVRVLPKQIDGECYNRIRVQLLRHRRPVRVEVPDHRGLELILTDDAWLGVDAFRGDVPILAWSQFQVTQRQALYDPVPCQLSIYHKHGGLVMGSALEALAEAEGEWEIVGRR